MARIKMRANPSAFPLYHQAHDGQHFFLCNALRLSHISHRPLSDHLIFDFTGDDAFYRLDGVTIASGITSSAAR